MPINAVGREIPSIVGGRHLVPYKGAYERHARGWKVPLPLKPTSHHPDKMVDDLDTVFDKCGITHGACLSFHHHLRNGDHVINMVMETAHKKGLKGLKLAQSALFSVHEPIVKLIENGTIASIEGSMNGPVGRTVSEGKMHDLAVLRSHGSRVRAIHIGALKIDTAFVAAPIADQYGNANGREGPSACGPLGYALADSRYAKNTVVVTDNLQPYPVMPPIISQVYVDWVVKVNSIGDPEGIATGTMQPTTNPERLDIARQTVELADACGVIKNGFSFQAGAGGISLAALDFIREKMKKKNIKARFAHGGITGHIVDMLNEGLIDKILDTQSFDIPSIQSLNSNPKHHEIEPDFYANPFNRGQLVNMVDLSLLGATEVDIDFNVNVNTHSDGYLLHGIGGHQDVAAGSKMCIVTCPTHRKTNPIVMERVTNVTTPGETIDAIVTEAGIAINPKRVDMIEMAKEANLNVIDIQDLAKIAEQKAGGKPPEPEFEDRVVAIIAYRDGTVIDVIYQVKK
ncbi:MAG: citrate lyase subunit alpha [Thermoplasmata archaeon]|nr:citrate lyase subunit alpha [Thermoplasmata archaeon]